MRLLHRCPSVESPGRSRLRPQAGQRASNLRARWSCGTAALAAAAMVASGCGAPAPLTEDELFAAASAYFEKEDYLQAIDSYDELLEQHPFSEHAESASLQVAHAHYLRGQYPQAVAAFEDFERLYPISPELAFAEYLKGMSYLDQALTSDRDQGASENAIRHFQRLSDRYPSSLYASLASFRLRESRENLATHELYVGDYYRERQRREAAAARYRYVLENYSDTRIAALADARLDAMASEDAAAPDETP